MIQDKDISEVKTKQKKTSFFLIAATNFFRGSVLSLPSEAKGALQRGVEMKGRLLLQHAVSLYQYYSL